MPATQREIDREIAEQLEAYEKRLAGGAPAADHPAR